MEQQQQIAQVTDAATGYRLNIKRIERNDYTIEYLMEVLFPDGATPEDQHPVIDGVETITLSSDGTGHTRRRKG
jgi:hypothetical protein